MKTSPKQPVLLNQLLFPYGSSANILSSKTEISVERLEQMFARGDGTATELQLVADALKQPLVAIRQLFTSQVGNFNQAGKNQRQRINTRDRRTTIKVQNLNVYIQVASPGSKPAAEEPNAHLVLPQQENSPLLLGSQGLQVGRSLAGGRGF